MPGQSVPQRSVSHANSSPAPKYGANADVACHQTTKASGVVENSSDMLLNANWPAANSLCAMANAMALTNIAGMLRHLATFTSVSSRNPRNSTSSANGPSTTVPTIASSDVEN